MAKTPAQRGPIGTWLVEQRQQRGWTTAVAARRELLRLGGIKVSPSVYAEWESGSRIPNETNLARLVAFYGSKPGTKEPDPSMDVARLVDALTRALEAQATYLTQIADLRAEVGVLAREAQEERAAQSELLGRLAADLAELRSLAGRPSGSVPPGAGHRN